MKKIDVKSMVLGLLIGTVGITTVVAANGIKTANFSNVTVSFGGAPVPLENSLIGVVKDTEKDLNLYMPVRELLEYLGYSVHWEETNNNIDITENTATAPKTPTVPEVPEAPKIPEVPDADPPRIIYGEDPMRKYYDNESEIANAYKHAYFKYHIGEGNTFSFNSFVGCTSLYEFDLKESAELIIDFQSNITEGKFKLVLVTSDDKVTTISETITPDSIDTKTTLTLPKGKNMLKIVGLDTSGNYTLTLSGKAYNFAESIGL